MLQRMQPATGPKRPSRKAQLKNLLRHGATQGLSAKARMLLAVLFAHTSDDGLCWPSQETLMELAGLSETAVKNGLRELVRTHTVLSVRLKDPMVIGEKKLPPRRRVYLVLPLSRHTRGGLAVEARLKGAGNDAQVLAAAA